MATPCLCRCGNLDDTAQHSANNNYHSNNHNNNNPNNTILTNRQLNRRFIMGENHSHSNNVVMRSNHVNNMNNMNNNSKSLAMNVKASNMNNNRRVTCCQKTWRVWRYCCCRYGTYPVIVAPVVTAACLLSLYSSAGCEYVDLQIGFTPSNSYNHSEALLGLFFYYNDMANHTNPYREQFHHNCDFYTSSFETDFITNDRTWKVARVMAMIAAIASVLCAIVIWMIVISPLPVNVIWPGILLPLIMLSFIAEGSKFLIFDIALCSNAIWLPSGIDSLPQPPESCGLGKSAVYGIAAAALFLIALLMICLHTPDQRLLDPDYGLSGRYFSNGGQSEHMDDMDLTDRDTTTGNYNGRRGGRGNSTNIHDIDIEDDVDYVMRDVESDYSGVYSSVGPPSHGTEDQPSHPNSSSSTTTGEGSGSGPSYNKAMLLLPKDTVPDQGEVDLSGNFTSMALQQQSAQQQQSAINNEPKHRISESRISKMEELEQMNRSAGSAQESLLQALVSDLNTSLGGGENDICEADLPKRNNKD